MIANISCKFQISLKDIQILHKNIRYLQLKLIHLQVGSGSDWPMCHCAMAHGPLLGHQMGP